MLAVIWYLASSSRFKRSVVPLGLTLLALAVQVVGAVPELGDRAELSDNIIGMAMLLVLTGFALWQYLHQPSRLSTGTEVPGPRATAA